MELNDTILTHIETHREEAYQLLLTLARIPAPSNQEERRAEFCKGWLDAQGAKGVYVDDALNVIYPIGDDGVCPLMVFAAHSDVVFPDTRELPLRVEDGRIKCPGIGDDTANVVALLMAAQYIARKGLTPKGCGVLLVINAGEEGLGDLKGTRKLMQTYGHRVKEFVTFDSYADSISDRAVGSRRYLITMETEGGHSLVDFGNRNAIAYMASLIGTLYTMKVPEAGRSTYNVGTISGGTSVNTIAQHAQMRYEFRSDVRQSLEIMEAHLQAAVALYRAKGVSVTVTPIGDRPCSGEVDPGAQAKLTARAVAAIEACYGWTPVNKAMSTDCNIPLSMGIPSVCTSCVMGAGAHTREEEVEIESLWPGLKVCFQMILTHF